MPPWLIKTIPKKSNQTKIRQLLDDPAINTVCENALCPNRGECFSQGTVTFLILGNICTRGCRFCSVKKGKPDGLDITEPGRVAKAVKNLDLKHAVITSVTRDDLPDGGAQHFADTIKAIRSIMPQTTIEVLTPDLNGDISALRTVIDAGPDVFNHNLETVPRLYPQIRPQADYERSLNIFRQVSFLSSKPLLKAGLMVGLGENFPEVCDVLKDLYNAGCRVVTIGQYLQPSTEQVPVTEYVQPEIFESYREFGKSLGLLEVFAGPWVRSSYKAELISNNLRQLETCE
jgi:lipoic acid synthetase